MQLDKENIDEDFYNQGYQDGRAWVLLRFNRDLLPEPPKGLDLNTKEDRIKFFSYKKGFLIGCRLCYNLEH